MLRYFCVTFSHMVWACLFVFNMKKFYFWQMHKPFHTRSDMNKPQAEENVNSHLYSRKRSSDKPFWAAIQDYMKNKMQEKKCEHFSAFFIFIYLFFAY